MKVRELLKKIDNAIRPPHVGPLPPTDVTALGGNMNAKDAAEFGGAQAAKTDFQIGQMGP